MSFDDFFHTATGNPPYGYQRRLACGSQAVADKPQTLRQGANCQSQLINIPTGLGKTAAVVFAWLWNRIAHADENHRAHWPRRLVYCLPMRTLVEQTCSAVEQWLETLQQKADADLKKRLRWLCAHSPVILMGGEETDREDSWDIHPEREAILIGTQDMLLSRALNRGYGMSRYRWPMHFGLLNNDALWVMDETQLMGVGVETSAQLDGFHHDEKVPTVGACRMWWMSATLDDARLATVDHSRPAAGWPAEELSKEEKSTGRSHALITAAKKLSVASLLLSATTKTVYSNQLAALIRARHQTGTLTLVVVNRVSRAREIFEALTKQEKKGKQTLPALYDPAKVALIHSRFRPVDRERHTKLLFGDEDGKGDRIVVATQAVEAGVDVSARLLVTELSPWSSLVQRMGRCNRYANIPDAEIMWVDIAPKDETDDLLLPYTNSQLEKARTALAPLTDASPKTLSGVTVPEEKIIRPVIRRRDLVDLFDTTPDICGQDLDISRYIRDGEDNDVQFYWRNVEGEMPPVEEPAALRRELCRVSIGDAREFLKKARAWQWNPLEEKWERANARPGAVCLIAANSGGYHDDKGWTKNPSDKPTLYPPTDAEEQETYGGNRSTFDRDWQTIAIHTDEVVNEIGAMLAVLSLNEAASLRIAALWHDVGKAHKCFQAMLRIGPHKPDDSAALYAKSKNPPSMRYDDQTRPGFRHELASALAWLLGGPLDATERDLIAYLIAAHHGKVRLSIRSLPKETSPDTPMPDGSERLFARGVWQGDCLPAVSLSEVAIPEITLDLSFIRMGEGPHGPSWLARTVALRDRLGSFRLAFLETLLRAADARASAKGEATA